MNEEENGNIEQSRVICSLQDNILTEERPEDAIFVSKTASAF